MHGIVKPIDKVISTKGTEWHGLADLAEVIDDATVAPLLFDIVSGAVVVDVDGTQVKMGNHKALVADYRACRPDLVDDDETSGGLVPLHIPKSSYLEIPNRDIWEAMKKAITDIDAELTCAGTLEAGRKFFLSARLGQDDVFTVNSDKFLGNLNLITSHDGSLAVEAYDSTVRIVCMNTLRWSREAAGEVGFKVYHSKNADFAMKNLGDLVNRILTGRADFKNQMEYLATQLVTSANAEKLLAGYFVSLGQDSDEGFSTRTTNTIDGIINLFANGKGNFGKNLYDLTNGITEFYTSGDGTGKRTNDIQKMYKANFGRAADHKNALVNAMLSPERVKELIEGGKKALAER